jgi:hypothetical protein
MGRAVTSSEMMRIAFRNFRRNPKRGDFLEERKIKSGFSYGGFLIVSPEILFNVKELSYT